MTTNDLISIVIPTYNQAEFLKKCLKSVVNQTYSNWEAIVVNNHSEDNTVEVVNGFNDDRIRLISYKNNGIIAASRNVGIRDAKGHYVAFLDSDDLWYPNKLARCHEVLKSSGGVELVCHDEIVRSDTGEVIAHNHYGPASERMFDKLLFRGNCLSTSATIVERSVLIDVGGFREDRSYVTAEDYDLWIRLSGRCKFAFIHENLGEYILHANNLSKNLDININNTVNVVMSNYRGRESKHFKDGLRISVRLLRAYTPLWINMLRKRRFNDMLGCLSCFHRQLKQQ